MTDCVSWPPLSRCLMSPGDQDHVRTSPQIPESQSPINETMSDHHLPRQRFADNSPSAMLCLCWLLSASQFLFGCQFQCLTLAGIIVACQGRASDPSLGHWPGTLSCGNQADWDTGSETSDRVSYAEMFTAWSYCNNEFLWYLVFYVKAKAFPSYFRKLQRM